MADPHNADVGTTKKPAPPLFPMVMQPQIASGGYGRRATHPDPIDREARQRASITARRARPDDGAVAKPMPRRKSGLAEMPDA